ncbi:WXG100 family type VII secretion target [Demequina sediminicola]|uniref:WXG100 family type VII secretion target n=1 Tax=Demequina sediminicola TaxID=1095026 RepID=UPI000781AD57|nr:WXG100 family type VII secretion target [Demequina sediminicola]
MTQFNVDSNAVSEAGTRARASSEAIRTEVAAMVGHLTALEGSWQGGAATAFARLLEDWRAMQVQVELNLDSISMALDNAAVTYSNAEDSATQLFTGR